MNEHYLHIESIKYLFVLWMGNLYPVNIKYNRFFFFCFFVCLFCFVFWGFFVYLFVFIVFCLFSVIWRGVFCLFICLFFSRCQCWKDEFCLWNSFIFCMFSSSIILATSAQKIFIWQWVEWFEDLVWKNRWRDQKWISAGKSYSFRMSDLYLLIKLCYPYIWIAEYLSQNNGSIPKVDITLTPCNNGHHFVSK